MPFILVPYTLGTQLIADAGGTTPTGGAAYYARRKRFIAYCLTMFLMAVVLR